MKKFFVMMAAVLASAAVMTACTDKKAEAAAEATVVAALPDSVTVMELTNDSLLRPDYKVERLTVIDFNAVWCGPCQMLKPSFHAVADSLHGKVDFYSVDIDNMKATANAFGVQAIPTLVVMSPADSTRTYVGLEPYVKGVNLDSIQSIEELNGYLTPGLIKVIEGK